MLYLYLPFGQYILDGQSKLLNVSYLSHMDGDLVSLIYALVRNNFVLIFNTEMKNFNTP